ncbi:dihydrodipicolinate reductase [Desulfococcaceae bacterium HSG7]|nr:dihydrodipicolinate reductase [Desulfococcaceae bacterium HSG7]
MDSIKVMVNGIPGNMACNVAKLVIADQRFELVAQSFTGPEITAHQHKVAGVTINLIQPDERERAINEIRANKGDFIVIDYTHPSAVNDNAEFYCLHNLPFVMGTTGGERQLLEKTVSDSANAAVIAPNMAKQIVGFQAMMEYAAESFPGLFEGYTLTVRESHQKGKADTSGTAKAMVKVFNQMGVSFSSDEIIQEREPEVQLKEWDIPEEHLKGHGWHTYALTSEDSTVHFEFTHNVNGRDVYAYGTLDAVSYLHDKVKQGAHGLVYTMTDVLKA